MSDPIACEATCGVCRWIRSFAQGPKSPPATVCWALPPGATIVETPVAVPLAQAVRMPGHPGQTVRVERKAIPVERLVHPDRPACSLFEREPTATARELPDEQTPESRHFRCPECDRTIWPGTPGADECTHYPNGCSRAPGQRNNKPGAS